MKVLMIGLTPPLEGGSQRHIYEISSRIPDSEVLTQKGSICKRKIEIPLIGRPAFLRNILFLLSVKIYSLFLLLALKKKYDIIHIHENLLYLLAPLLRLRYKVIITVHGIRGFKFYDNKLLWFFFRLGLKSADKVIAVSISDKELLDKELRNVVYIPNGVDFNIYKNIKAKVEKKITFVGRIHEQKGIVYLLEAFDKIKGKYPDYRLEIMGEINSYAKKLQKRFDDKRIIWRGFISDRREIARSLKSAYCIALPSLWEGLPLTLFEALASGRPVIATALPGMHRIFENSKNIILIPPRSTEKLADAITHLINKRNFARTIGTNGKRLVEQYSWNKIAANTSKVYEL